MASLYITEHGSFVHKRGGRVIIGRNNEVLMEVPIGEVDDVTLIDTVQISSELITEFSEHNVPISWLSSSGKYFGSLLNNSFIDINKHKQQFDLLQKRDFYFKLAQKVIKAKTYNQLTILRRYNRTIQSDKVVAIINEIQITRKHILFTTTVNELMGYEGLISKLYFEAFGLLVKEPFQFVKRSKKPPRDPVNSMLSIGYSMLFNEILANLTSIGIHPYVGFIHSLKKGHPALVSDLIEEWRAPLIDSLVLNMIRRNMIKADMFTINNKGCFFTYEARKLFLQMYNKKLRSTNHYLNEKLSYRNSIKKQCNQYAFILLHEDIDSYIPMELK